MMVFRSVVIPIAMPFALLVVFMKCRRDEEIEGEESWITDLYKMTHLLFAWSLAVVREKVRSHSPTKKDGDPYAAEVCRFVENTPMTSKEEKRCLFVCLQMCLSVRSSSLLDFFTKRMAQREG